MADSYPENCIRGISRSEGITQEGTVGTPSFYFSGLPRGDGWKEESINWQDDGNAIEFTLAQEREDGSFQFRYGVAILPIREVQRVGNWPTVAQGLAYERIELEDNPYHGNLLLKDTVQKPQMLQIAATLALASRLIRRNTESQPD